MKRTVRLFRRVGALLLIAALLTGFAPSVSAAGGEGSFCLFAATASETLIEPVKIPFEEGQTIQEALDASPYSFERHGTFIDVIEGAEGGFLICYDGGGYDLTVPASEITALVITENEAAGEDHLVLVREIVAVEERPDHAAQYPAVREARAAALTVLRTGIAATAVSARNALLAAVEEYETLMGGDRVTVTVSALQNGAALPDAVVTLKDGYGNVTTAENGAASVVPGTYLVTASDGGRNRAETTVTVESDASLTMELPCGEWFGELRMIDQATREAYAGTQDASLHTLTVLAPDTAGQYAPILNAAPGPDVPDAEGTKLYAVYTGTNDTWYGDTPKSWSSNAASLTALLAQGMGEREFVLEARYASGGQTQIQTYSVTVQRFPTLASLSVKEENTTVPLAFDPLTMEYALSVTADAVTVSAAPYGSDYSVTGTGTAAVTDGGRHSVTVAAGGRSTEYTICFEKKTSVGVTLSVPAGTAAAVYNGAGSEILPVGSVYHLVPGEPYSWITTKNTWYHASGSFTAAEGLTVTVTAPDTTDRLTALALFNGSSASTRREYTPDAAFSSSVHSMGYTIPDAVGILYAQATPADGYDAEARYDRQTMNGTTNGKPYAVTINAPVGASGVRVLTGCVTTSGYSQTVTVRVSRTEGDVTQYQDYELLLRRQEHLKSLALFSGEDPIPLLNEVGEAVEFDRNTTEHTVSVDRAVTELSMDAGFVNESDATAACGGYYAMIAGERFDRLNGVTLPLDQQQGVETVTIRVCHEDPNAVPTEYTITVNKTEPVAVTFVTDPADATVFVISTGTGKRVPGEDGVFPLVPGQSYECTVTAPGYVGSRTTYVAPASDDSVSVTLARAPAGGDLPAYDAFWGASRFDGCNNAAVDVRTPTTAEDAALYWAVKVGEGYSSDACGCPILVDGYLYTYAGNRVYKIDTVSGEILASGIMDHSSSFAINTPTYAEGMLFIGESDGTVQAFNASTLESLWIYHDARMGQPNCPIVYKDGRIYTGFWNGETALANYVCLTVTDEDPGKAKEEKLPVWTYASKGGFYWAGAYAGDGYLLVCTDDGSIGYSTGHARILSLDRKTGETLDSVTMPYPGDLRSGVTFVPSGGGAGRGFFTSKGGYFCRIDVNGDGTFVPGSLKALRLTNFGAGSVPMSTSTPTVYNGRAYVGVSGASQFGQYSGHNVTVIDLNSWTVAYSVRTQGYPQSSGLLTTAYEEETGCVNVYFFDNYTPGKLRMFTDRPGQTSPSPVTTESFVSGGTTKEYDVGYVLFTPYAEQAQYAICSPIADEYGTIYFKNDSACMMAVGSRIESLEITEAPVKTRYAVGDAFDPTGMRVTAVYANGLRRDVTEYVEWSEEPLTALDTQFQIWFPHVRYHDENGAAGTAVEEPFAVLDLIFGEELPEGMTSPEDVTVEAGKPAAFSVTGAGEGCSFRWQVSRNGGVTWADCTEPGSDTATIAFTPRREDDGNRYRCVITQGGRVMVTDAAVLTVTASAPVFKVQNLVLSGQIGVNFFLDLDGLTEAERSASYMEFSIDGKGAATAQDPFDANHRNASKKYYGFTFYVNSIQMADTITATFHYGDGKTVSRTYSVEEYFETFDLHAAENPKQTVDLVHAIADYGHYMQLYLASVNGFTLGTDYAELTRHYTESYDWADILSKVEEHAIARTYGTSKVEKANYRLQLGSETTLDVFLKTTDGSAPTDVTVTIREEVTGTTTTKAYTPEKQADGRYLVTIPNISAHKLGDKVTITGNAGGSFTVVVSPLSFVRDVLTYEKDTESRNGLSSLYAYWAAAMAYKIP